MGGFEQINEENILIELNTHCQHCCDVLDCFFGSNSAPASDLSGNSGSCSGPVQDRA